MKLLIGGKNRNIYMRKDGSAYYKSRGENVDVTHMFKKNGGGLKKQYIGGVQNNLAKVEQKKRSKRNYSLVLGGADDKIVFPNIEINSSNIVPDTNILTDDSRDEFKELCRLAMFGAYSVYNKKILSNMDDDNIKIEKLKTDAHYTALHDVDGITCNATNDITVSRGYILNKVLGAFSHSNIYNADLDPSGISIYTANSSQYALSNIKILSNLNNTPEYVDIDKFKTIVNNINNLRIETETANLANLVDPTLAVVKGIKNIHGILFQQEKIGKIQ